MKIAKQEAEDHSSDSTFKKVCHAATVGGLDRVQPEAIVAAIQRIGPGGDRKLWTTLVVYISELIMRFLRKFVSIKHRNKGNDIIEKAHEKLIIAALHANSTDGKGLRKAFVARVRFRALDEIVADVLDRRRFTPYQTDEDGRMVEPEDHRISRDYAEQVAYVEHLLSQIPDPKKCLAFRLHMEGVPAAPGKGTISISEIVKVSPKTVGNWIGEVQDLLIKLGVKDER